MSMRLPDHVWIADDRDFGAALERVWQDLTWLQDPRAHVGASPDDHKILPRLQAKIDALPGSFRELLTEQPTLFAGRVTALQVRSPAEVDAALACLSSPGDAIAYIDMDYSEAPSDAREHIRVKLEDLDARKPSLRRHTRYDGGLIFCEAFVPQMSPKVRLLVPATAGAIGIAPGVAVLEVTAIDTPGHRMLAVVSGLERWCIHHSSPLERLWAIARLHRWFEEPHDIVPSESRMPHSLSAKHWGNSSPHSLRYRNAHRDAVAHALNVSLPLDLWADVATATLFHEGLKGLSRAGSGSQPTNENVVSIGSMFLLTLLACHSVSPLSDLTPFYEAVRLPKTFQSARYAVFVAPQTPGVARETLLASFEFLRQMFVADAAHDGRISGVAFLDSGRVLRLTLERWRADAVADKLRTTIASGDPVTIGNWYAKAVASPTHRFAVPLARTQALMNSAHSGYGSPGSIWIAPQLNDAFLFLGGQIG